MNYAQRKKGGERMTIWMVDTYAVKPDKLGEFPEFIKKFTAFVKKRPDLIKEIKSFKINSKLIGGTWGGYVEMYEFENVADFEKCFGRIMQDKEFMTEIYAKIPNYIVLGSESIEIWNSVI
jgi:hypothetical protein